MTDRIDHAAEARKHIEWAHDQQEKEGDMGNVPRDDALLAQAEAILALVEQQRIANLIALAKPQPLKNGGTINLWIFNPETKELRAEIAEGLGL